MDALIIRNSRDRKERLDMTNDMELEAIQLDSWMGKRMKDREVSIMNTGNGKLLIVLTKQLKDQIWI